MRDYAQSYRVKPHVQIAARRSRGRMVVAHPLRLLFWKTAGSMVVVAMCTGVVASFWIGHRIQSSLTSIATLQQSRVQEQSQQNILVKERDELLSTKRMVARAAVQHNLYQAGSKQHVRFRD